METEAGYGMKCSESFARYDQDTSSWRTSQLLLTGEWEPFSEGWPKAGIMLDGRCYRQPKLERRIAEIDGGVWATPRATMPDNLSSNPEIKNNRIIRESGEDFGMNLADQAKAWPTPRSRNIDYWDQEYAKKKQMLCDSLMGGQLNPMWVEWLMGYPLGWTALDASETA